MAASSGHLTPAEAAPPDAVLPARQESTYSDISRQSPVPTIASTVGNISLSTPGAQGSGADAQRLLKSQSGRNTSTGYRLRGSRTPSLRDPNAQLDELNQIPERPEFVPPKPLDVTQATEEEDAAVRQVLKKSSKLFHKHKRRQKSSTSSDAEELNIPATAVEELERADRETLRARKQLAERQGRVINVYDGDAEITTPHEVPEVQRPGKAVYVWEVMYENQRGMSLLGKKWYSANSLLPTDPTAYTLPTELPGVTTISAAQNRKRSRLARKKGHSRARSASTSAVSDRTSPSAPETGADGSGQEPQAFRRRTNNTGYTLKTYQTPSPDWTWLTPWMVNMRSDADEQGFRYNLWFHRRGWRPQAGRLNWWGWVRRREWLRLRVLLPSTPLEQEANTIEEDIREWPTALDEIMARPRPVLAAVKILANEPLDRVKHQTFMRWWNDGTESAQQALRAELRSYDNLELLSKAFVFASSRRVFLCNLAEKGIVDKAQADDVLYTIFAGPIEPPSSATSSPELGRSRSLRSAPSDPQFTYATPPARPGPAPISSTRSPASSSFSSPPTPRTPTFRAPESRHFPFNYAAARTKSDAPEPESPMKEPSEGDVD